MRTAPLIALALAGSTVACSSSSSQSPASTSDAAAETSGSQDGSTAQGEAAAPPADAGASTGDSAGGSRGDSGSGAWSGTIGSGTVPCYNNFDSGCPPHTACCDDNFAPNIKCVTSYADCTACANGACPIQGCSGPQDCPGQACCALIDLSTQFLVLTGCKPSCDALAGEYVVCKSASDCPGQTRCHDIFGNGYMLDECEP
jgi:hypothetical protein